MKHLLLIKSEKPKNTSSVDRGAVFWLSERAKQSDELPVAGGYFAFALM
jgi:hypothetical protein